MATLGRRAYAEIFGPTTGDRVRLADTGLLVEVEKDYTLAAGSYVIYEQPLNPDTHLSFRQSIQ